MKDIRSKSGLSGAGILATIVAVCGLLVLLGCRNPLKLWDAQNEVETVSGTGAIALTVNGQGMGRTIMPTLLEENLSFYLEFEALTPGSNSFSRSWDGENLVELSAGEWRLRISSYIPDGPVRRKMADSGWVEIVVTPGIIIEYNIVLVPIAEGYGTFSWDIDFSADVASAGMRIVRIDGGTPSFDRSVVLLGYGATSQTSLELPVGLYRVVFTLYGSGGATAEVGKLLHIHLNLTSRFTDGERLFADFIFPAELLQIILGAWTGTEWDFDLGDGRRITAGHFGLLSVNGVDSDNFDDIVNQFNRITTAANVPADRDGLKALVDAALISIAVADPTSRRANNAWTQASARTAIENIAVNIALEAGNFDWTGPYTVTVTVGTYPVNIVFVPVLVENVVIAGLAIRPLVATYYLDLSATVEPSDARNQEIRWEIPNEAHRIFAEVYSYDVANGTARVRGLAAGDAAVYAVSVGNGTRSPAVTARVLLYAIPITGIEIDTPPITLEVGEYEELVVILSPGDTTDTDFTYVSSNESVARVEWVGSELRVVGVSVGTATITVTSTANGDLYDTVEVEVRATPTGVTVTPYAVGVPWNRTHLFTHTVLGPTGVLQNVTWNVEPPEAGTIVGGLLTLVSPPITVVGNAVIVRATAYDHPGVSGYATVTVLAPKPDNVVITQGDTINVARGTPVTFAATVGPTGTPQAVTWSIVPTPTAGAMIDPNTGVLATAHPLYHGSRFIVRAEAVGHSGVYDDIEVTITVTPTGIVMGDYIPTIILGGASQTFAATVQPVGALQNVEWSVFPQPAGVYISVDPEGRGVLTVASGANVAFNDYLIVTARVPGTTFADTATVTVTVPPTGVTITSPIAPVSLDRGASLPFAATVQPAGASQHIEWSVSGSGSFIGNDLTIDSNAVVHPPNVLTVTATASGSNPPVSTTIAVTVTSPAPTGVSVTTPAAYVELGHFRDFTATVTPLTAHQSVEWSVSPVLTGVTIASEGYQVGRLRVADYADVYHGQALTVTARVAENHSITNTATVTVIVSPTGVTIGSHTPTMVRGASQTFTATVQPTNAPQNYEWSVSPQPAGVSIDQAGRLTIGAGTTATELTVTARVPGHELLSHTVTITILEPSGFVINLPAFPPPGGNIVVTVPGYISLLGSTVDIVVSNPEGYSSITWFFGGRPIGGNPAYGTHAYGTPTGAVLRLGPRIHGELLPVGDHFLTVEAIHNGEPRSMRVAFEVRM